MFVRAYRSAGYARRGDGFTIVELLIVVAVISILLSILLPTLGLARDQAKTVVCASRLKQWGLAFECYAATNVGYWPHCDGLDRGPRDLRDPNISREDVADWHGWVDLLPPVIDLKPWRDYPRFERPKENTFYQCRFARPESGGYSYQVDRDGYFSYAMNSCLELDLNAWPPPDGKGYPMPSFLDTARIRGAAQVILLFDQLMDPQKGYDGSAQYRSAGKHCGSYPKAFSARHRRSWSELGGNILYADGHVAWQKSMWQPWWDLNQEVPPRDDPNWYPYPVAGAD